MSCRDKSLKKLSSLLSATFVIRESVSRERRLRWFECVLGVLDEVGIHGSSRDILLLRVVVKWNIIKASFSNL